jgi:Thrombospondin type 3 repeat
MFMKFIGLYIFAGALFCNPAAGTDLLNFTKIATHPSNRELSHEGASSEEAQGIAFEGSHWFYANKTTIYRLSREFRNSDRKFKVSDFRFDDTKCGHVGGIDFYGGELYAALDHCLDGRARVAVFNTNLEFVRFAILPELCGEAPTWLPPLVRTATLKALCSFPWVAVNPIDDDFFYTEARVGKQLLAFPRRFSNGTVLISEKAVQFREHPQDVLHDYWKQGGAFSKNGLFFLVADDKHDKDSDHTGIWVYELEHSMQNGTVARRVGFINIRYDPDNPLGYRGDELEDVDASTVPGGATAGDLHVIMLSNEWREDDLSVFHYLSGDYDGDGVKDVLDNCFAVPNPGQEDSNGNGIGNACEVGPVSRTVTFLSVKRVIGTGPPAFLFDANGETRRWPSRGTLTLKVGSSVSLNLSFTADLDPFTVWRALVSAVDSAGVPITDVTTLPFRNGPELSPGQYAVRIIKERKPNTHTPGDEGKSFIPLM